MEQDIDIPNNLDERLFVMWEMEESLAAIIGFMVFANFVDLFVGLLMGYVGFRSMRAFKAKQPRGAIMHWLYWVGVIPFQKTRLHNGLDREFFGK